MIGQRGVVTLTTLLVLSSVLTVFLLFNETLLQLYSLQTHQYSSYVKQSWSLQQLSQLQKNRVCDTLPLLSDKKSHRFRFSLSELHENSQYVWCYRSFLFKYPPRSAVNEQKFDHFIHRHNIDTFRQQFHRVDSTAPDLYWLTAQNNTWDIEGNKHAVIIAEGDLHIRGKGKIMGTVITAGTLTVDSSVKITYHKSTVEYWLQHLSRWQVMEKSWHDFNPL